MGAEAKFLPTQSPLPEQMHGGLHSNNQLPEETDRKKKSPLARALSKLLGIIPLGILLSLLVLGIWLAFGSILGKMFPERTVTVQQFEISSELANRVSVSGKTASDIVVDILNDSAKRASAFHGTDYYSYALDASQPLALRETITVPLQASYGIVINGISLDSLIQLYDRQRYQQWTIGGDVISFPKGLIGRIRLNQGAAANSWETAPSTVATPADLVREATYMMLTSVDPELLGRSYLQQGMFPEAEKVFRQWEEANPLDWKPTYYLSLAYDYHNQEEEANDLADWSRKIEALAKSNGSVAPLQNVPFARAPASDLAKTTRLALKTASASDTGQASVPQQRKVLAILQSAEAEATTLADSNPENADYRIQLARILDQEALTLSSLNPNSFEAPEYSQNAIRNLNEAIKKAPNNAGLYEQRAILYMHLVAIMNKPAVPSLEARRKEEEELKDYTRALEMRPSQVSLLWGAVYAQLDLHQGEDAIVLSRTINLLEPGSTAAGIAYIVALEGAQSEGLVGAPEKEVEARLNTLLQSNLNDSQLQTLYWACQKNNNRKGIDLVATEGKRRFPSDPTFQGQKPSGKLQNSVPPALPKPPHS
jgi:Flp pilus assembly protein TadD